MKTENYLWVASVIAAHPNGEVYGRTRLQKTVKLLQRLGMPSDYSYQIHFYGPYSEALQSDISLLEQFGLGGEECRDGRDGTQYYVLRSENISGLPDLSRWKSALNIMSTAEPIVLELAATYDAFREQGATSSDALVRLRAKKGQKCADGREERALQLLGSFSRDYRTNRTMPPSRLLLARWGNGSHPSVRNVTHHVHPKSCQAPKSRNSLATRDFRVACFPSKSAMLDIEARN